jgi:multicomponent Na+:H+ antiporter subunit E
MIVVRALVAVGTAAIYLLALGSTSGADALFALALGTALSFRLRFRAATPGPSLAARMVALPAFMFAATHEVLRGSWIMLLVVLGRRPWQRQGIVEVPIGERSELGITVSGYLAGLSPGTVLLHVDPARGVMVFHCIDAADPDRVRDELQRFYDRYQRRVFP